jgi:3-hydroxyacyl-CoA dehydrogenase
MVQPIRKVAVLGAGVMGQGIAAHLANSGVPSILFDIVPRDLPEGAPRSQLSIAGIANASKLKPAAFYRKDLAAMIEPANYDDDGPRLAECDLIIEVVVERLDIKNHVFGWVAQHRSPGSIVASNTSGLKLSDMTEAMNEEMASHFLITHFFNPVRYMRLLELVTGPQTLQSVTDRVAAFGEKVLGKGIVFAKDTPNFIANRIGTYGICSVFSHMEDLQMTPEEVDTALSGAVGRPRLGVFGLGDLVGLDTLVHVLGNVYNDCPEDEQRDAFQPPEWLTRMVDEGALGNKTRKGFYQRTKDESGKRITLARDLETGEYAPKVRPRFDSIKQAKAFKSRPDVALRTVLRGEDKASQLVWGCTSDMLVYSANRIPEIADDIVNLDRAMRWGFNWDMGPFETWDCIGVAESVSRMKEEGTAVPSWVETMLASGRESFYSTDSSGQQTYWDPASSSAKKVPLSESWLILSRLSEERTVAKTNAARLVDLGDGVLGLRFTNPEAMNALDPDLFAVYGQALDQLDEGKWEALVVGTQGDHNGQFRPSVGPNGQAFCAGANLGLIAMLAAGQAWDQVNEMIEGMQKLLRRAQYSERPVVTAPFGLALGGGCELAMQASACQTVGELYTGLVEVGMGLLPAGGGCKEMIRRYLGDIPSSVSYDPNPFVQAAFMNIGLGKVSTSAEEARDMRYIRSNDRLSLDPDALIHDAKQLALGLARGGYQAPRPTRFKLPGNSGRATIEWQLGDMVLAGHASEHDARVAGQIAHVLCGGDIPAGTWVSEQHILDLEREGFLSLLGEAKTMERIQIFLTTGKIHRN